MSEYDEDEHFPIARGLAWEIRYALAFYARERNYRPFRDGIEPVIRDGGKRAARAFASLEAIMERHDRALVEKYDRERKQQ